MPPLVSILIPAFNSQEWIADTLRSALAQTWPYKEIIVVDDGSTDQTLAEVRKFASQGVKVVTQKNQGAAAARNHAFSLSRGDFIQWLDADDLLSPDKISRQMAALAAAPGQRLVASSGWAHFFYRPCKAIFTSSALWRDLSPAEWLLCKMDQNLYMQTGTWLVSRELTEKAGPWDTRLLGDDDGEYFCRVLLASGGVKFVTGGGVYYRVSGAGSRLSYIGRSARKMEAQFLSMKMHIDYLRSVDNSPQARKACVQYLQNWSIHFYPEQAGIFDQMRVLARELGGNLNLPALSWKYGWIRRLFGWGAAKYTQITLPVLKQNLARQMDGFFARREPPFAVEKLQDPHSTETKPDRHDFSTDHLLGSLKRRTISGGIVQAGSQGAQFVLMLGYNVTMARLLTPHEFGLVAIVMTILAMLHVFRDMGLSTATIQRPDITHAQVSNLFWLNTAVSGTISLLLASSAPFIAWFFHETSLIPIVLALSLVFTLNGLGTQHTALLNRNMRFGTMAAIDLGSIAAGVVIGVTLALAGFGYWSLVANTLAQAFARLMAIWSVSSWRPQAPVRKVGTRPMINFGANLTLSGFIFSTSRGLDALLIGRFYGSDSVGLYTRAGVLLVRPLEQLITPIYNVIVPVLSRLHARPGEYRSLFLKVFEALAVVGFLFASLAIPLAKPLTLTLLGAKWEAAAVIFAGLSVAAISIPLSTATSWLYTSQGRGLDQLRLSVAEAGINVTAVLIGLPFGPLGVAIAISSAGVLVKLPLTFYLAGRSGPVSFRDLSTSMLRHLPVGLVAGGATWVIYSLVPGLTPLKQLLVCCPVGLLVGAATILISPPSRQACLHILDALKEMRKPVGAGE